MGSARVEILVIDDSEDDVFAIRRQLKHEGLDVHCHRVDDAENLYQALKNQLWDVALCDIKMPNLTPERAIEIMDQTDPPSIPIIMMSGMVDFDNISNLIRGGTRDFLPKSQLKRLAPMIKRELAYREIHQAQQQEHEMFVEAQKMEAVGTLAGGIAHDFNNILTALIGLQWKLKSQHADLPNVVEKVDKMDDLCHRASDLVKQLLGFARKGIVQRSKVELAEFISENISLFRMSVPENIYFDWQPSKDTIHIMADVTQLQQMLINLINNARDASASAQQPCIQIEIERCHKSSNDFLSSHQVQCDEWVCLSIANNGQGILEDVKKHIFEPFFTTKAHGRGTGLGLAMVYGTMQSLDGLVEAVSQSKASSSEDICTQMNLYFPRLLSPDSHDEMEAVNEQKQAQSTGSQGAHILIADDEDMVRDVLVGMLELDGYQVTACANGKIAMACFEREPDRYAMVILDVVMPTMGGPEMARIIRKNSEIPIMLISGYDMNETLSLVEGVRGVAVVTKPFTPIKLLNQVSDMLSSRHDEGS